MITARTHTAKFDRGTTFSVWLFTAQMLLWMVTHKLKSFTQAKHLAVVTLKHAEPTERTAAT